MCWKSTIYADISYLTSYLHPDLNMNHLKLIFLFCGILTALSCEGQLSIEVVSEPQNTACDGELIISINENNGPYTFLWSNGATTQVIDQLCVGAFAVTITGNDGCDTELEMSLSGSSDCPSLMNETFDAVITSSCSGEHRGSVSIQNSGNFEYSWGDNKEGSSITNLASGSYCVTISERNDVNCFVIKCYSVPEKTNCGLVGPGSGIKGDVVMIVNEISNGLGNGEEFIELVVVKADQGCGPVDVRGYIIDDNNGDFSISKGSSSSGVAPGHFRFSESPVWEAVPVGSIILLYNSAAKNQAISLSDDPTDADNNKVYVVPSGSDLITGNTKSPSLSNSLYAEKEPELSSWSSLYLYDGGDAVQIRSPEGKYTHGISYGSTLKMNGGPDDLLVSSLSGAGKGYAFTSGSYTTASSFLSYNAGSGSETPGAPNNEANDSFISNLCSISNEGGGTIKDPLWDPGEGNLAVSGISLLSAFPNPFTKRVTLEIHSDESKVMEILLSNITGGVVERWMLNIESGVTTRSLELKNKKLVTGLYTLSGLTETDGTVFATKLVKLQ